VIDLDQTDPSTLEAELVTSKGSLVVTFFADKAPGHVHNFLKLCLEGFYDGTAFHRVIRNFMIQGGCPNTRPGATGQPGTGRPEGTALRAEFNDTRHTRGVLSMARGGHDVNSAGSQFFVVHAEQATHLDGQYTAFGVVEEGLEVLDEIAGLECEFGPGGEKAKPKERVEIERVEVRQRQDRAPTQDVSE